MNRAYLDGLMDRANAALSHQGFECIETEWNQHDQILRLFIDHENGVDLEGCVKANKILDESMQLDQDVPAGGTLEVSSPGVERPLRRFRHFEKHVGAQVLVRLTEKVEGRRTATGRLVGVGPEDEIVLELPEGDWRFPLGLLHRASLVYEWRH
jgi:ribosome maturation factor RimP